MPEQRTRIFGLLLLAAAGVIWWFQQRPEEAPAGKRGGPAVPDYIVNGFNVTVMDEKGAPWRHLEADVMQRFEAEDRSELNHPKLVVFEHDRPHWKLRAKRGRITSHHEVIELLGACTIEQSDGPESTPVYLRTRDLRIDNRKHLAETAQAVTIESGANRLSGVGMQLWFKTPMRLKLLSKVRSHYEIQ